MVPRLEWVTPIGGSDEGVIAVEHGDLVAQEEDLDDLTRERNTRSTLVTRFSAPTGSPATGPAGEATIMLWHISPGETAAVTVGAGILLDDRLTALSNTGLQRAGIPPVRRAGRGARVPITDSLSQSSFGIGFFERFPPTELWCICPVREAQTAAGLPQPPAPSHPWTEGTAR